MTRSVRVLLLSSPFVSLERPSLGLSLLKAQLQRRGHRCDVRYLTFPLAELMGRRNYDWITDELPYTAFVGDWLFARSLYGRREQADGDYLNTILHAQWGQPRKVLQHVLELRTQIEPFLEYCLESIPFDQYSIVGFTSTFSQNVASLSLARRIKRRHPRIRIVFGGANWEGEMGRLLHRRFRFVDFAFSGEADESFPQLVELAATGSRSYSEIPGLSCRDSLRTGATTAPKPISDLDDLPYPDFDDFFEAWNRSTASDGSAPNLLIETSRGCWWGARQHCTFCGLNGQGMAYRSKSPARVLGELRALSSRYEIDSFEVVDNILDMDYLRTLLPALAAESGRYRFFYETKANLSAEQMALLHKAGVVRIQPGIESLSDSILGRMRKGTTALKNLQLLKWCREFDVHPDWNLIYGFPGEDPEEYSRMVSFLPQIQHLTPPSGMGPVRLDRFSPYHASPEEHGITEVRPMEVYRHLYPFPAEDLKQIAYYFDFDYEDQRTPESYAGPLIQSLRRWERLGPTGDLTVRPIEGGSIVVDQRRNGSQRSSRLVGWQAQIYQMCDRARGRTAIFREARAAGATDRETKSFLETCVARGLMIENSGYYLSLAIHRPAREFSFKYERLDIPTSGVSHGA